MCATGVPAGKHIKVFPIDQLLWPLLALRIDDRQPVLILVGVDKDNPLGIGREDG